MRENMNSNTAAAETLDQNSSKDGAKSTQNFVALVGSPNTGKTTLFNWLTGSRFKTVNYPGATIDYSLGRTHDRYGEALLVMDTPGTYSLDPKSPDERVTMNAIFAHPQLGHARVVVAIADSTQLSRQLLVPLQLKEAGFNVVLAVTMADLLKERGDELDVKALSVELGLPVVLIDGRLGGGVQELTDAVRLASSRDSNPKRHGVHAATDVESTMKRASSISARVIRPTQKALAQEKQDAALRSRKIDQWLMHPVWGLVIFGALMTGLFSSIFWVAAPAMDFIDGSFTSLAERVLEIDPDNLLIQFLSNGVVASLGAVLVFIPQIFILFIGIIMLEDSGYLARSATLIDKPLSKLGLGGRSFVPILSGYACAVPAMMAARTINSRRERWLTLFIVPLMSCSARLPVYALLLAFLFHDSPAWHAGLALAAIYFGSLVVGGIAAALANRVLKIEDKSFFMLELPVYRKPKGLLVLRQAIMRTKSYLKRAGPPIFVFALLVWVGTTFPNYNEADESARLNSSYAAQVGQVIEPIFEPMGGDWRTGVGLISAFAAREVFVSSLAVVFQVAEAEDESTMQETLLTKMTQAKAPDGYPLFTFSTVLALIVFFMIALQCLSTVVVAQKEGGSWKFALGQLAAFNLVAYVLAVAIVQGLRAFGIA